MNVYDETKKQLNGKDKSFCVNFAIKHALKVLPLFEKKYPDDKRPKKAIIAAQEWLKNPTLQNQKKAVDAIWAANAAAWAAGAAAGAAGAATDAAAGVAAGAAAGAAANAAAGAAFADCADRTKTIFKIDDGKNKVILKKPVTKRF